MHKSNCFDRNGDGIRDFVVGSGSGGSAYLLSVRDRIELAEKNHPKLSMRKKCELLGVARSSVDYQAVPENPEDTESSACWTRFTWSIPAREAAAW